MVKIQYDKKGPFVRYKGHKIHLSKKMAKGSQNDIIKWLVKKLITMKKKPRKRKRKTQKSKLKPEVKQMIDKNLERVSLAEKINKQLADDNQHNLILMHSDISNHIYLPLF